MPISIPGSELVGWHTAPDGRVGIGTATLDDGATLTVNGSGNISLHGEQVRLTSPTSTPPSLVGRRGNWSADRGRKQHLPSDRHRHDGIHGGERHGGGSRRPPVSHRLLS